ncbi:glycosyltransferase family 2 protein [Candidatus Collierbacteria bacterium]|nr:glycosyltransferase family 2 protein [Candidatus Collierbacteria bacterium]
MIYILIPAYNEEQEIESAVEETVNNLGKRKYQLVVVDDGSYDKTVARLRNLKKKYSLEILQHDYNLGPGAAVRTGIEWVLARGVDSDIVITMESGGVSEKDLVLKMVDAIEREEANIVLAGCYTQGGGMKNVPLKRQILSRTANGLLRLAFPISGVSTYSSLLRAYQVGTLKKAENKYNGKLIVDNGFFSTVEMLIKLSKCKWTKIKEIPMTLDWGRGKRISRMRIGRTIMSHLINIIKYKIEGY